MSSTVPLSSQSASSTRLYHFHRLVRLLVRCYYEHEAAIVMDTLLILDARNQNSNSTVSNNSSTIKDPKYAITDQLISTTLNLSVNRIKPILQKFRADQILSIVSNNNLDNKNSSNPDNFTSENARRKGINKFNKYETVYTIDYTYLSKVIKYKNYQIYKQLNKQTNKNEVFYVCPTLQCPLHNIEKSVIDLLLERDQNRDIGFVCKACSTFNEQKHIMEPTKLIVANSGNNNENKEQNENNGGFNSNQALKDKFNKQIQPILQQLKIVDDYLADDLLHPNASAGSTDNNTTNKDVDMSILNDDGSNDNLDSKIQVDISNTNEGPKAKVTNTTSTVAVDQAKGKVSELPWNQTTTSLAELEAQRLEREEAKSQNKLTEQQLKEAEEKREFDEKYQAELEKLKQNTQNSSHSNHNINSNHMTDDSSDPILSAGGRQVRLSQLTQEDIEAMNDEEFSVYDSYVSAQPIEFE